MLQTEIGSFDTLLKAVSERERLVAVLIKQERRIYNAFIDFVRAVRSNNVLRAIRLLLERRDFGGAFAIMDTHINAMSSVIPSVINDAARSVMQEAAIKLPLPVGLSFDPSDYHAAQVIRRSRLEFIQGFTNAQRDATRTALAMAFETGAGPRESARAFNQSIGLTARQIRAVENYRQALERGSLEALNRELRDRRFDGTVERAFERNDFIEPKKIDRMVQRYYERLLRHRAETIARTEGLRATSIARDEALRQVIKETGIDPRTVKRRWLSTRDHRTRDTHRSMNNQTVGLDEPFISPSGAELMYPGDPNAPAAESINCRCVLAISFDRKVKN